jgi:hypothetical protein
VRRSGHPPPNISRHDTAPDFPAATFAVAGEYRSRMQGGLAVRIIRIAIHLAHRHGLIFSFYVSMLASSNSV